MEVTVGKHANPSSKASQRKIKLVYGLVAIVAFLGGVAIYAVFRDIDNMLMFRHLTKPSFLEGPWLPLGTDTVWGYLFVFNLPHGLWALSGLLVIRAIWLTDTKWRAIYGGIFIVVASSFEIGQISERIPGTFDALDLASYGVSALLESMTYNKFIRRSVL